MQFSRQSVFFSVLICFLYVQSPTLFSQSPDSVMLFEAYNPPSTLVVPQNDVRRAKFPFVDVHNHQWMMPTMNLDELVASMDSLNLAVMVNLSGRSGDYLTASLVNINKKYGNRFLIFANIDFKEFGTKNWTKNAVKQLEKDFKNGAAGLKIYKNLGLTIKDEKGNRLATDDPRLDPIWELCGKMNKPVLIHTGEPAVFWQPVDKNNERWLEMKQFPDRWRGGGKYPDFETVMAEQHHVFKKHPKTTFINAHLGWFGHDLTRLAKHLDEHPNVVTEIGAVLAEIGRQPRAATRFFTQYQDRILFGKDIWRPSEYHTYFRVLETDDEYFDYYRRRHAFWKMYGMNLPDEILKKLYYKNALTLFPQIDKTLFE